MITIIVGSFREGSISSLLGVHIERIFKKETNEVIQVIDLKDLPDSAFIAKSYQEKDELTQNFLNYITQSEKVYFIVPEYNGSFPGCLKHFIDLWKYPTDFENKKIAFCGIAAGIWGGLRPVEHLMGIFSYRETQLFYKKVYISNSYKTITKKFDRRDYRGKIKRSNSKICSF